MSGLADKRVLVTRPRAQAEALLEMLAGLGAVPILFPTIEIGEAEERGPLDRAIAGLRAYRWVIFTSANGVAAFWQRLVALGEDENAFGGVRVAAIGPATAQALRERGVTPEFVPAEYVAEAILPGLGNVRGQRILLPRADIARRALVEALEAQGAFPEEIAAYRTLPANPDPAALSELERGVDVATFTSSSTVRNYFLLLGERARELLGEALIVCIGPVTAETARSQGLEVGLVAAEYTVDGLVDALVEYYGRGG
ncbi:MAG TPA: uroporphyrinogen-III synthase [Anaerolineaceae bacterium]|nr:uroporphyrinogen-III synthase [Anaerolineaceae bacterium]